MPIRALPLSVSLALGLVVACDNASDSSAQNDQSQGQEASSAFANPTDFGCQSGDFSTRTVQTFAQNTLRELQFRAFSTGQETCGWVVLNDQCRLSAAEATASGPTCTASVPADTIPLAHFHIQSTARGAPFSEVPSSAEFDTAALNGLDSYVGTPGGKLWHIDGLAQLGRLICESCLPVDPRSGSAALPFGVGVSYAPEEIAEAIGTNGAGG